MELTAEARKLVEDHARKTTFRLLSVLATAAIAIIGIFSWNSIQTLVDNVAYEAKDELRKNYQTEAAQILDDFELKLHALEARLNDVSIGAASELQMRRLLDNVPKYIDSGSNGKSYELDISELESNLKTELTNIMEAKIGVSVDTAAQKVSEATGVSSGDNFIVTGSSMVYWGQHTTKIAGYNKVVFNKAFSDDNVTVSATAIDNVSYVDIKNISKSGFEYQFTRSAKFSNYSQAGGEVHFIAAGKL